jgi:hypothetical protein
MKHDIAASADRAEIKFDYKLIDPLPPRINGALNMTQRLGVGGCAVWGIDITATTTSDALYRIVTLFFYIVSATKSTCY